MRSKSPDAGALLACWLLVLPAWQAANWDLVRAEAYAEATSLMAPLPGLIETMQEQLAGCTSHCTILKSSAAALLCKPN